MSWAGSVRLDTGRLVYSGTVADIPVHSSITVCLILLINGRIELCDASGATIDLAPGGRSAAVLPSGRERMRPIPPSGAAVTGPAEAVMAIVDPDSPAGRTLAGRLDATGLDRDSVECWVAAAAPCHGATHHPDTDDPAGTRLVDAALRTLAATEPGPVPALHPALARAVKLIGDRFATGISLGELAAEVGLSPSRLGHLFTAELHLPFRAYVRWARLQRSVDVLRAGGTLTDAAHAAGFTDSAHLNRVCRQMFGISPSELIADLRWV